MRPKEQSHTDEPEVVLYEAHPALFRNHPACSARQSAGWTFLSDRNRPDRTGIDCQLESARGMRFSAMRSS